jgi:1,4-alpha-glucan branching enzyme
LDVGVDPSGRGPHGASGDTTPQCNGDLQIVLNQCAREALLLQSSDWAFVVTTGQARAYAIERFQGYLDRFAELADLVEGNDMSRAVVRAKELYEWDKVFPEIDYRWVAERQGNPD